MAIDQDLIHKEFSERLQKMLDLVAHGRGVEILLRIAEQTRDGVSKVAKSYEKMKNSKLQIPNLHPPQALPNLFTDKIEVKRLELATDIADKLAHGLYRAARKLIDRYKVNYGLETQLNDKPFSGWKIEAKGHLIDDDGRRIESIVDLISSSNKNLITEEFDVFVLNNYAEAAKEIFNDSWARIARGEKSLANEVAKLYMARGYKRGKRIYVEDSE